VSVVATPYASIVASLGPDGLVVDELPGIHLHGGHEACSYTIAALNPTALFDGGCDPSKIGTMPVRVVAAQVLGETRI
jgi:hypothetical protein